MWSLQRRLASIFQIHTCMFVAHVILQKKNLGPLEDLNLDAYMLIYCIWPMHGCYLFVSVSHKFANKYLWHITLQCGAKYNSIILIQLFEKQYYIWFFYMFVPNICKVYHLRRSRDLVIKIVLVRPFCPLRILRIVFSTQTKQLGVLN
jgi:hypothetical protein